MKYFIIAGEASGDLHASNLMRELKLVDPGAEFCFLGGDLMQAQGGKMVKHYRQMAFMGFISVLKNAPKVVENLRDCKKAILDFKPDVVILVDYPSFNMRIARFVKETLHTPVYYYISPKIWAWKQYRIKEIKRYIDKMFVVFPFENAFYAIHNYPVEYVGNPSVDSVMLREGTDETMEEFCSRNNLTSEPIIALLPGSRKQEITECLDRMIAAARNFPDYQAVITGAPGVDPDFYEPYLKSGNVKIVFGQTYRLLQQAKAAVVNSGTASLETALIGVPQVVVYHVPLGKFGYWVKNNVIKVKYISLVNIITDNLVVEELIAHLFTTKKLTEELSRLLHDEKHSTDMLQNYEKLRKILGSPGAAQRTAIKMVEELKKVRNS